MAIQMIISPEGVAKFRAAMETGTIITLDKVTLMSEGGGAAIKQLPVKSVTAVDTNSNVYRFICEDRSEDEYEVFGGELSDGEIAFASFSSLSAIATKQSKAELLIGFEIQFDNLSNVSDIIHIGDTTFSFDDATETAAGIIELATEAEAKTGTDAKRAITPKTLDAVIEAHDNVVHRTGQETISGKKTFTDAIRIDEEGFVTSTADDKSVRITGGTGYESGASLVVYGKTHKDYGGAFRLRTTNGTDIADLDALPNGELTWEGKHLARSVDGVYADKSGNIKTNSLPTTGGTITGTVRSAIEGLIIGDTDASSVRISGGTSWDNGGSVVVYGKSHSSNPGKFRLKADDGSKESLLEGSPDGTLTWGGKKVVTMDVIGDIQSILDANV